MLGTTDGSLSRARWDGNKIEFLCLVTKQRPLSLEVEVYLKDKRSLLPPFGLSASVAVRMCGKVLQQQDVWVKPHTIEV